MRELKPCPFCGEDAKLISIGLTHDPSFAIICDNNVDCWASFAPESAWYITKIGAVDAWNRRTT